jgi:hypothetical protein
VDEPPVSTVYLGQFTREHANAIAGLLEEAGIIWWYKEPGWLSSVWEFGVRLFVDRERLQEARALAARGLGEPAGPAGPDGAEDETPAG